MSSDLEKEFREVAERVLKQQRKRATRGDIVLHEYDAGSKPDMHEVEYIHLSDQDYVKDQLIPLGSLLDVAEFTQDDDFIEGLRFYVIVVQPQNAPPLYCFRSYSAKKELARSRWAVSAILQGNNYFNRLTTPLFLFDRDMDCIASEDYMFIFNQGNFHKIFQFFEYARKVGAETLRAIHDTIPIQNFDAFADSCKGNPLKLSKLRNIMNKPHFQNNLVTIDKLKVVISKYNLNVPIVTDQSGLEMLVYDSKHQWEILTLLDDGYLESLMTGYSYEVNSSRLLK